MISDLKLPLIVFYSNFARNFEISVFQNSKFGLFALFASSTLNVFSTFVG